MPRLEQAVAAAVWVMLTEGVLPDWESAVPLELAAVLHDAETVVAIDGAAGHGHPRPAG